MPVNVSNKRLRQAKNLTYYGAPYGGFGFGVPVKTGTSVWSMRLYPRMSKESCCVDSIIKSYSNKKCCNDPKLRAEITTVPSDPTTTTSTASTIDMTNVPNLYPSDNNHVVSVNTKWVDQGGADSSTFEVDVTGDEASAILNAQNNINSETEPGDGNSYTKFHYDSSNKKIVYFSNAISTSATGFITYEKTSS